MATFADGSYAERDIELRIVVLDENDCAPVIKMQQVGSVNESSAAGILRQLQYICDKVFLPVLREVIYQFIHVGDF